MDFKLHALYDSLLGAGHWPPGKEAKDHGNGNALQKGLCSIRRE
jgi:hypothetical protein